MLYRIYRLAFALDMRKPRLVDRLPFGPRKTLRDDIRMLKDRVRVDGTYGRIA